MKKYRNYTVGLDIGTGSVGWAVIDEDYNLCKFKGKDAWGAFIFDDAETAVARRTFRAQRRRYDRRRERIRLLQELMSDLVLREDDSFFIRLRESSLRHDITDTSYKRNNHYNLFEGEFTDRDFYNKYKTIYHLRDDLCNSDKKADIRLVYLALHHILKYRGNFLYEGQSIASGGAMIKESLSEYFLELENIGIENSFGASIDKITAILQDSSISKGIKKEQLKEIFKSSDTSRRKNYEAAIKLMLGYKANLGEAIFAEEPCLDDNGKAIQISFSEAEYESNEESYLALAQDKSVVLLRLKSIYTATIFERVTRGNSSVSKAKIQIYDKHKKDLAIFKKLIKNTNFERKTDPKTGKLMPTEYYNMFRKRTGANYVNYVGSNQNGVHYDERIKREDFYKSVQTLLNKLEYSEEREYCLREIERGDFLPLINSVENSAIPYQMHKEELLKIIDNQSVFYPELSKIKDKITAVFEFKRPYYVGPLKGDFSWCEQIVNERIMPWNFYDLVDADALAEQFIQRMTNYCTVFKEEPVLPSKSIVYQAYTTLNEINKIKYKNKTICTDWKKCIFTKLCCVNKTVKVTAIAKELKREFNIMIDAGDISGLAEDKITANMSTYIDLKSKISSFSLDKLKEYEEAIRILTLFNDGKIIKKRLKAIGIFTATDIEKLCKMRFSGWGRYSAKLLNGIKSNQGKTIVETLYDTAKNINELLFEEGLGYKEQVRTDTAEIKSFDYKKHIEPLYCSPSVKKAIWNALKIVEEITKIAKCPPSRIFLEDTREMREKKATDSRAKHLQELYKVIEDEEYFNEETDIKLKEYVKKNIDTDKLYLWLLQLGRCMYSGEIIHFDQISECEIDHIVPRSYIKDDSFENRVLVKKIENQMKTNTLSISRDIQRNMSDFWTFLYKHKFIGNKKWQNLTRGEYTESDTKGFINRQLVETGQIVKEVKNLLAQRYGEDCVVHGIRAGLNSTMREKYARQNKAGFYKLRSLNQLHHAKDAYLTAVIGQFTSVACPLWGQNDYNKWINYHIQKSVGKADIRRLVKKKYGIVLDLMESTDTMELFNMKEGEYLWDNNKYLNIFRTMEKNNCLIVKKTKYYAESAFYDQTVYGVNSGKTNLLPLKAKNGEDMPTKYYGGYSSEKPAFFAIVKSIKKTKKSEKAIYSFAQIPVMISVKSKKDDNIILDYIKAEYGEHAEIVKIVHKYQLINYKGHMCYITGTREQNNAVQLIVDSKFEELIYNIEKNKLKKLESDENTSDLIKEFVLHYNEKIRAHMPYYSNVAEELEKILLNKYDSLTIEQKADMVKSMLVIASAGAGRSKLLTGDSDKKEFGRLTKTVYPEEVEWIDNSCTGLYSSVIKGVGN